MPRLLLFLALLVSACSTKSTPPASPASSTSPDDSKPSACPPFLDDQGLFRNADLEGVFIVRDAKANCIRTTDAALADAPSLPHSTFKIPNALIGLETGVLSGPNHPFAWDGTKHSIEDWNRDHDLASAMRVSCVWCFQDLARRVGEARMRQWIDAFDYGNERVEGAIDNFWLEGSLRITPRQQIDFIRRMLDGELPVRKESVDIVSRWLELEREGESAWYGKTGLGEQDERVVGWLVGYVEAEGRRYEYATFVRGGKSTPEEFRRLIPLRKPITRALLVEVGALEP